MPQTRPLRLPLILLFAFFVPQALFAQSPSVRSVDLSSGDSKQTTGALKTQTLEERVRELEARLERMQNSPTPAFDPRTIGSQPGVVRTSNTTEHLDPPPAPAAADREVTGRLSKVEDWINKYQSGLDKKKADAARKPTFKIGGRIHADYWGFPNSSSGIGFFENPVPGSAAFGNEPENRFLFRRIRLEMRGDIFEYMMWRVQVDFNNPSTPEIKDVWIGFKNLPCNTELLIGNQKRPLGLDHLNSSRFNIFMERPLVVESFNEDARRPGIALYGNNDDDSMGWVFGGYLLQNVSTTGRYIGDSSQGSINARWFGSPWYENDGADYLHLAVAGMFAKPDGDVDPGDTNVNEARFRTRPEARSSRRWLNTGRIAGADWFETLGFEAMYNAGPLQITSEYQFNWTQRDNSTAGTGPDVFFQGAYVQVAYFLTGEHMAYNRKRGTLARTIPLNPFWIGDWCRGCHGCGWGAWQVALRYSYLDLTDKDILGGVGNSLQLGINWYWTSHSHLQFGAIYGDIQKHAPVGGYTAGHYTILGTRFAVDF